MKDQDKHGQSAGILRARAGMSHPRLGHTDASFCNDRLVTKEEFKWQDQENKRIRWICI